MCNCNKNKVAMKNYWRGYRAGLKRGKLVSTAPHLHPEYNGGLGHLERGQLCTFEESVKRVRDRRRYARVKPTLTSS